MRTTERSTELAICFWFCPLPTDKPHGQNIGPVEGYL